MNYNIVNNNLIRRFKYIDQHVDDVIVIMVNGITNNRIR